ncbi:class I SAM-dependent methyltransferase [Helicobacter sp. MIT 21-1697]|uniref:class I SAM-dependent methyltransferase n=1 Tax=Helicobacter sp. MIT 21-1697 TaxID=2993733 RepID=UPI00224AE008|nr:class I SAM-dependent methyltransferase [Helicobacter sp. MIT 21-1697]MCX2716800.1 class I SAM-dependent methyltransferase [Helicobacter sp. MIT 21-1697]
MQKHLWDKKAQTFPRFVKDTEDTLEILAFFKNEGVRFAHKRVLDIGAGNGRFGLQIAFEAAKLYATDISKVMLDNLQIDAQSLGLKNVSTLLSAWEDVDIESLGEIDIAFASMTPALNNLAGFIKAINASKEGLCYVGWGRVRESAFLDEIFAAHYIKVELPVGLPQALQWLKELGYKEPTYCYKEAAYTYKSDIQKAINDIKWHICMHQGEPDEEKIKAYLDKKQVNGYVSYEQKREVGICFIPRV